MHGYWLVRPHASHTSVRPYNGRREAWENVISQVMLTLAGNHGEWVKWGSMSSEIGVQLTTPDDVHLRMWYTSLQTFLHRAHRMIILEAKLRLCPSSSNFPSVFWRQFRPFRDAQPHSNPIHSCTSYAGLVASQICKYLFQLNGWTLYDCSRF